MPEGERVSQTPHHGQLSDSQKQLRTQVEGIVDLLSNGLDASDYEENGLDPDNDIADGHWFLSDVFDIVYEVRLQGGSTCWIGADICVAFGGPNIWVKTREGVVEGAWWGDRYALSFEDGIGLRAALEELWGEHHG